MIKSYFIASCDVIKKLQPFIILAAAIFGISTLLGAIFHNQLIHYVLPALKQIIDELQDASSIEIFAFIYSNNLMASLIATLSGISFGLLPAILALGNGIVLGSILMHLHETLGSSHWWQIIPHGIFELPAYFLSIALGFYIGGSFFNPNRWETLKTRIIESLETFVFWVAPLLLLAAITETTLIVLEKAPVN